MRRFLINVNGKSYEVEVEELGGAPSMPQQQIVQPTPEPVQPVVKTQAVNTMGEEVTAPMPGVILRLNVKEGDSVNSGDTLLILEAMKMENEIVSPIDGKVIQVLTSEGANVNTSDKLLIIG